jgi:arylsulfatase A-like enzyme
MSEVKSKTNGNADQAIDRRNLLLGTSTLVAAAALTSEALAQAQKATPNPAAVASGRKPNILVIFGDDIGQTNVSAYSFGLMGYRTPNIDRIAKEGMMFTDYYAEQSCTAGRSSFITGQCTLRTGLSKVGIPGATVGLQARDATIAELLKPLGYATGQFGKNHLGDRNEYLPTVHGFDEFYGNLYHLNAEEDPENRFYPTDPAVRQAIGPRGVLRCKASDRDDPTDHPRWGRVGKQTIEDTGPLTKKRMETIDDETSAAAIDFMQTSGPGQHAVLLLVQYHPNALPHPCAGIPS